MNSSMAMTYRYKKSNNLFFIIDLIFYIKRKTFPKPLYTILTKLPFGPITATEF